MDLQNKVRKILAKEYGSFREDKFLVDGDDTLWRNEVYYQKATDVVLDYLIRKHKIDGSVWLKKIRKIENETIKSGPYSARNHLEILTNQLGKDAPIDIKRNIQSVLARITKPEICPWAIDLLSTLSKHGQVYIHTRGQVDETEKKLQHTKLQNLVSGTFYSRKTKQELAQISTFLGGKERVIVIGDSILHDVEPAHALGVRSILLNCDAQLDPKRIPPSCTVLEIPHYEVS